MGVSEARAPAGRQVESPIDWRRVLYLTLASRALDDIEETRLVPQGKVLYQFSARGHDMAQIILGTLLDHPHDVPGPPGPRPSGTGSSSPSARRRSGARRPATSAAG